MTEAHSFGRYVLHTAPLRLTEGIRVVNLPPRQLAVLSLIVSAGGEVVLKDKFLEGIWNGAFIDPANLSQTVYSLRKALGRLPDGGEHIETVPRRGYRLAAKALEGAKTVTEKQFSSKEEQFRHLVESIQDYAIYRLDCAGRIETWNLGLERSKGYTAEEVVGQHYSLFFVPEDIEAKIPDRELARAAKQGRVSGEGWRIRKNGERFWASFVISAIRGPKGTLLGFGKVVRDLSERKRQEDAALRTEALLRRERDRLRAAAESSMDALYICEAVRNAHGQIEDFTFTYLNSNVEKMVAIPLSTMISAKMCEVLPVNRTLGLFDAYRRVVDTGEPYVADFPVEAEDVKSEWIRVHAVRLEDGIAITASDISEVKRLEREVARLSSAMDLSLTRKFPDSRTQK